MLLSIVCSIYAQHLVKDWLQATPQDSAPMPVLQGHRLLYKLHEAVQAGDIHRIDNLLALGCDVNRHDNEVCRPIYSYSQHRCPAAT